MDELKTKGLLIGTLAESEYYIQKLNDSIYVKFWCFQVDAIPGLNIGDLPKCQ